MATLVNAANELFSFDAKTTEEMTEDADVTENAVEIGGDVTDHRKDRPLQLQIEGVISESPLEGQNEGDAWATEFEGPADKIAGWRGGMALKWLRDSRDGVFVWISPRYGVLENLMIESIQTSTPKAQATKFRIALKQVRFAAASVVDLPPEFVPSKAQTAKECAVQRTDNRTDDVNAFLEEDTRPASVKFRVDEWSSKYWSEDVILGTF